MSEDKGTFETWTEELTVAGSDLFDKLQELLKDASVHRLRVVNKRSGKVVFDIPVAVGIGVALLANVWAVVGAAVLYAADFEIVVEHRGPADEAAGDADDDVSDQIVVHPETDAVPEAPKEAAATAAAAADVDQCQGKTKAGAQCKRKPTEGSAYCYTHQPA